MMAAVKMQGEVPRAMFRSQDHNDLTVRKYPFKAIETKWFAEYSASKLCVMIILAWLRLTLSSADTSTQEQLSRFLHTFSMNTDNILFHSIQIC
jgi:hypothetical protein